MLLELRIVVTSGVVVVGAVVDAAVTHIDEQCTKPLTQRPQR